MAAAQVSSVAGLGVPIGAYQNVGAVEAGTSYDAAQGSPVLASWAFDVPVMVPHTACTATTKKGEKCPNSRVADTTLCGSHWDVLAKSIVTGVINTAGAVYTPEPVPEVKHSVLDAPKVT